jgi:hypothetical protein
LYFYRSEEIKSHSLNIILVLHQSYCNQVLLKRENILHFKYFCLDVKCSKKSLLPWFRKETSKYYRKSSKIHSKPDWYDYNLLSIYYLEILSP